MDVCVALDIGIAQIFAVINLTGIVLPHLRAEWFQSRGNHQERHDLNLKHAFNRSVARVLPNREAARGAGTFTTVPLGQIKDILPFPVSKCERRVALSGAFF